MSLLDGTLTRTDSTSYPQSYPQTRPATRRGRSVDGRAANWLGGVFYFVVAAIALAGQTGAAVSWLGWPVITALPAVAALELGGIALAARADFRRRLGETAYTARVLSAAVAIFAVVFNWVGHPDHLQGGFFAGMSALGYAVWIINAEDRRRDHLREAGNLPPPAPVYGVVQWLRHPIVTRRARALARQYPRLGLYGSLTEARLQMRAERRRTAIAHAMETRLRKALDADTAAIAVATYDLDAIAERIAASADYERVATLVAADLCPERITSPHQAIASAQPSEASRRQIVQAPIAGTAQVPAPVAPPAQAVPVQAPAVASPAAPRVTMADQPTLPAVGVATVGAPLDLAASRRARATVDPNEAAGSAAAKASTASASRRRSTRTPKVPKTADAYANWLRIWRDAEANGGTNAEIAARNGGPSTRLVSEIRSAGEAGLLSQGVLDEITSTGRAGSLAARGALLDTGELRVLENVRAVPAA